MLHILASADAEPPPSDARAALVSIVVGEPYERTWSQICGGSWRAYADKYGFDIIVYNAPLDLHDPRPLSWQKLLILEKPWTRRYDRVIWLDSDVVAAPHAPDILEFAGPPDKIGVCVASGRLSNAGRQCYLERALGTSLSADSHDTAWASAQRQIYESHGLAPHDLQFNSGVMALSPHRHADLLRAVYEEARLARGDVQPFLSERLLREGLAHEMNPRFNWGVIEPFQLYILPGLSGEGDEVFMDRVLHAFLCAELRNAYFLHFYGAMNLLKRFADVVAFDRGLAQAA